ncbi:MAG: serine/threonine-protein kinase [Kofleriaceae bacterium]
MAGDLEDDAPRAAVGEASAATTGVAAPELTAPGHRVARAQDPAEPRAEASAPSEHLSPALAATLPGDPAAGRAQLEASSTLDALPERPEGDRLARAMARAKVANSLFPGTEQVSLGRYRLLELVGSGGMGVVWGAWDPELERRVAIKLVKATLPAARDRILLEGQALAKLSHPNVVPVFDVGVYEEQVYLVMEWVRGKNLRAYCKEPRTVRELLRIYGEAGTGLLAAHRAGLIHRDFKPDNAIVGDDGRVRVLDFGLARESPPEAVELAEDDGGSDTTRGAGTPRYMPPEQASGGALTAAVDQYAFCVSLREALLGRLPGVKDAEVPRWLAEVLARGAAPAAAARYPSMVELLAALERDPARRWRRRLLALGVAGLAAGAFAVGRARSTATDTCVGGREEIARVAGPAHLAQVSSHLRELGAFGGEQVARLTPYLHDYGERWAQAHRDACRARERKELSSEMYDRTAACMVRGKAALATILGVLAKASAAELPDALTAARDLPSIDRCLTAAASSTVPPPPPELAGAVAALISDAEGVRILGRAARPEAAAAAQRLVASARKLGYQPALAQALLSQQIVRIFLKAASDAPLPPRREATQLALQIGDDGLAVETFARELYLRSREGLQDGLDGADLIEALARGLGVEGRFARALLYNNLGSASLSSGDRLAAQGWFRRALDEARLDTSENVELAYIPMNLAFAVDGNAEAERLFTEGLARLTPLLGPQHPFSLLAQSNFAMITANAELARERATAACEGYLRWHPHLVPEVVECSYTLGWLADERGDRADAKRWLKITTTAESSEAAVAAGYLGLGERDAQVALEMEALAAEHAAAAEWWSRTWAADAGLVAALAWRATGQPERELRALEAALAIIEDTNRVQSNPFHQRRLSRIQRELARALATSDRARARRLADAAITWYRQAGGYEQTIERLSELFDPR